MAYVSEGIAMRERVFHVKPDRLREAFSAAYREGQQRAGGGEFDLVLRDPQRGMTQNQKFHAMIGDIHRQCFRAYSDEGVKAVLVNQFAQEMAEAGEPLSHPGEKVWDWKTQEPVYVRPTTTKFTKRECAAFIEYLYATGTDLGVAWSEKALSVYAEYREAQ